MSKGNEGVGGIHKDKLRGLMVKHALGIRGGGEPFHRGEMPQGPGVFKGRGNLELIPLLMAISLVLRLLPPSKRVPDVKPQVSVTIVVTPFVFARPLPAVVVVIPQW